MRKSCIASNTHQNKTRHRKMSEIRIGSHNYSNLARDITEALNEEKSMGADTFMRI